jgi:multidrug efflux pump subunit AcrA (membrane-fusion protein)
MKPIMIKFSAAAVLLAALSVGGYTKFHKKFASPAVEKVADEKPIANVQIVAPTNLSDNMIVPGVVRADGVLAVTTFSEGIVSACQVRLGERVQKGQNLCSVENDNPSATYLPYSVQAPASGTVGEIHAAVGARVNKGDKIVTILRSSRAKVEIEVPVQDAAKLKVGLDGTWVATRSEASASTETPIGMKITGISPLPDMVTRTVRIELSSAKTEPGLPGSMGKVTFVFNSRKGFEVAEDALQYRGLDPFLRVVVDGKVKWVPVKVGRMQKGKVEITGGVVAGTSVVTSSAKFLADGDDVVAKNENLAKK